MEVTGVGEGQDMLGHLSSSALNHSVALHGSSSSLWMMSPSFHQDRRSTVAFSLGQGEGGKDQL